MVSALASVNVVNRHWAVAMCQWCHLNFLTVFSRFWLIDWLIDWRAWTWRRQWKKQKRKGEKEIFKSHNFFYPALPMVTSSASVWLEPVFGRRMTSEGSMCGVVTVKYRQHAATVHSVGCVCRRRDVPTVTDDVKPSNGEANNEIGEVTV